MTDGSENFSSRAVKSLIDSSSSGGIAHFFQGVSRLYHLQEGTGILVDLAFQVHFKTECELFAWT